MVLVKIELHFFILDDAYVRLSSLFWVHASFLTCVYLENLFACQDTRLKVIPMVSLCAP